MTTTECPCPEEPKRDKERAAKRLAAILTRKGPKHRVRPCGTHWHVYPDPLMTPEPELVIPDRRRGWRR